ncbi:hypothetical protein BU23DRAFT_528423 [Bimuria novae-zelandiae CBS 107.79]|uniref:Maintenance of telomere capping protein 6 n=1 Tax=Bimuria novae-zelandiae CBS 107.79 TaxID=1447943 RepID=A0A6A5VI65_9PLEO|nr:hypothetical protein BU23DRAFT_528423 [Bimuria novae-zelandiae CBS 107.79]
MADSLYVPDARAKDTLVQPWDEAFRAQRDVGLLVPIDFHTVTLVSLRAACFGTNQYEDTEFQKCFSNLLAVGLRRFVIDVYWDALRATWSLCPAEIPPPSGSSGTSSTASVPTVSLSSISPTIEGVVASVSPTGSSLKPSSVSSSTATSATSPSASSATPSTSSSASPPPGAPPVQFLGGNILYELGDYNCTSTMTLNYLTGIFSDFLEATATTTDASFTYLLLNIHAAASWARPNEPAQQPASSSLFSATGPLLSAVINGNLSAQLYTPSKLASQRADLSDSWLNVNSDNTARPGYYTVHTDGSGLASTQNGWPDEAFIQFRRFYRVIAVFGTVDPQMALYNRSQDASTIFPSSVLNFRDERVRFAENGSLTEGCLFDASDTGITPQSNSSFAIATVPAGVSVSAEPDLSAGIATVGNMTACGISPLLNHTLGGATAAENPLPYAAFTRSSLWSWAPGEPLNATAADGTGNRCAAAYTSGAHAGRWHVVDCSTPLRVACQDASEPYKWAVSEEKAAYERADDACTPLNMSFSVPHTPLENSHLLAVSDSKHGEAVLLNFNSLDIPDCWVAEVNATCPYQPPSDQNQTRIVVVPTIAAIIIFVCTALTFFVKCASNRREDKRGRRRMMEGWEYEGVPS